MTIKKIKWIVKRHPYLYLTRFRLLSKNVTNADIEGEAYNTCNPKADIPAYFHEINTRIFPSEKPKDILDLVLQLSIWLQQHIKGGPGLSYASEEVLRKMLLGEGGVCSDRVQVFNNFCVINDVKVREWGVTGIPFDKSYGGHSFNEVFIPSMNKWIAVDVSYCGFFYAENQTLPLSVIEIFQAARQQDRVLFKTFLPGGESPLKIIQNNYLKPGIAPFLVSRYNNVVYDRYLKRYRGYLPVFVIHFMVYLSGKSYRYLFPLDDYKRIFG